MAEHIYDKTASRRPQTDERRERPRDAAPATIPAGQAPRDRTSVTYLQHLVGNQAVRGLLAPSAEDEADKQVREHDATDLEHRADKPAAAEVSPLERDERKPQQSGITIQRAEGEFEERPNQDANVARLEMLLALSEARHQDLDDYASTMTKLAEVIFDQLSILSSGYKIAYDNFRGVIDAAQAEAKNQQWWTDFIVDVVCGVVAGLVGGLFISESSKVVFQLGKKAITRSEIGIAAITSGGGEATAGVVGKTGLLEVAGQRIDTSALYPAIREAELWKNTARILAASQQFSGFRSDLHDRVLGISQFISEIGRYSAGGEIARTPEEINAEVATLEIEDEDWMWVNDDLPAYISAAESALDGAFQIDAASVSVHAIERTIWMLWISGLAETHALDLDEIEEHIGPNGLRLVDFGDYTTRMNEIFAAAMAREKVETAKTDLASLGSLDWGEFPLGVNPSTETWFEHLRNEKAAHRTTGDESEGTTGYEEEWSD